MRWVLALALAGMVALASCGGNGESSGNGSAAQLPGHIHGLGVNPSDGALFIATHSGLFRAPRGVREPARVDDQYQDTMGFSVIGPDRFIGSGHPALGEGGPPHLGLIESEDAGRSWESVSLAGEADFHVLRFAHGRVYGYNGLTGKLMLSDDLGRSWSERTPPAGVIDLAVDPDDPNRILASTERGLALSEDEGESWRPIEGEVGLLAWPESGSLYLVDAAGRVSMSADAGGMWRRIARIGGQPVALAAPGDSELYVGLPDGRVKQSLDGGASWRLRASL
jgi:photosystem II stability/assembly factor-like uncharacterized protein